MPPPEAVAGPSEDDWDRAARARLGITLLGKWTLDSVLGVGGMSAVYAATHRNGNRVAIKVLRPDLAQRLSARGRFVREAYAANRVARAGGVAVLDDGVDGALVFLVMELLDGGTLSQHLHLASGRLGLHEALRIGDELLGIVSCAHACGIVHRDLKPDNIFLLRDGKVRVLDFGLARVSDENGANITRSHATLGTPAFMAPEQARGRPDEVDARTDLWGVGATLFTCLTGRYVHPGETANEVMIAAGTRTPSSIAAHAPELPRAVTDAIDRALAFHPTDRWQTAAEMRNALREAQGLPPAETTEPSPRPRTTRSPAAYAETVAETSESSSPPPREERGETPPSSTSIRRSLATSASRRARAGVASVGVVLLAGMLGLLLATRRSSNPPPAPTVTNAPTGAPIKPASAASAPPPLASEPPPPSSSPSSSASTPPPAPRPLPAHRATPTPSGTGRPLPQAPATDAPTPRAPAAPEPREEMFERRK